MNERGGQDGGQPSMARRVKELEDYFHRTNEITLEELQEKIRGIPPGAVRGSDFFGRACYNQRVTLEMIECLLGAFPEAARTCDGYGYSPLHYTCANKNMDPRIVRLLLDRWPESVNRRSEEGRLPLHFLCETGGEVSLAVLDLLLVAAPQSVEEFDDDGALPIHNAIRTGRSYPFCQRLIDANPESLRVHNGHGWLPVHTACYFGDVKTVKYLIELYPESIGGGLPNDLPIHYAARSNGKHKVEIIRYLLSKDPTCASKTERSRSLPLHMACGNTRRVCLESVRLLFDAYPEAITIRDGRGARALALSVDFAGTPLDLARRAENDAIAEFMRAQLVYARWAEDTRALHTSDENGWPPLHRALQNGARLGAINLLTTGNPSALRVAGNGLTFPLHIACEFSSVGVVEYLLGLSDIHLHTVDAQSDSTLHYAIRGGNLGVVKYLLERHVPSVSEPNSDGKLPIHLLWESDRVDRNSVEYVDAVWRLLLARPETVAP